MNDLKFCRICLNTKSSLYHGNRFDLINYYENFINVMESCKEIPYYFCNECSTLLMKASKFKEKCETSQQALDYMLSKGALTQALIANVNRQELKLESSLSKITSLVINFPNEIDNVYIVEEVQTSETSVKQESEKSLYSVPIEYIEQKINYLLGSTDETYKNENDDDFHVDDNNENCLDLDKKSEEEKSIKIIGKKTAEKNNVNVLKRRPCKRKEKVKFATQKAYGRPVDPLKWKVVRHTEDEMIEEFNKRKDVEKTEHHCEYCIKNFRSEDTLKRHMKVHSKTLGKFACFLCKRRFKWEAKLRVHMKSHQLKFHCLKCFEVFNNRGVALQHERMHDGVSYQCKHCPAQFMKISTYYTHLRDHHRSEHVCQICGESFVSGIGLRLHLIRTHNINPKEQPKEVEGETDKSIDTYCEKCDITFQTNHAFDEHLNNSAMHVGDCELIKELNAKPSLLKQNTGPITLEEQKTCPQCSLKFLTSKAYERHMSMKHEGRTKYKEIGTANRKKIDNLRYICEICGANLAPASKTVHQRMHQNIRYKSNKKFPCETCGKVFSSAWNRNQHITTHTGEKPFSCKLCDKKFTQQQSALKHFRRCH